jgi:hypothetical protein
VTVDGLGGVVGELTLTDASLGALVEDMRSAMHDYGGAGDSQYKDTTGQLADEMLRLGKAYPVLQFGQMRQWLIRVKEAAEARNAVVHAIGRDRCVQCGRSTHFDHRGKQIDRSETRVRELVSGMETLIIEGVQLAHDLSARLNERLVAEAKAVAGETGQPRFPTQIKIAGIAHQCSTCSESGQGKVTVSGVAAVAVMPPGTDLKALLRKALPDGS